MKTAHILLVEDNEGDIMLTKEALQDREIVDKISVARNGKEALDFVFKVGKYINETLPDLILLDVNMPIKNGHEVLQTLKNDQRTKLIPVIMLTTSSSERDINLSYQHYANCYITKPIEMEHFFQAMRSIEDFWMQLVQLPGK